MSPSCASYDAAPSTPRVNLVLPPPLSSLTAGRLPSDASALTFPGPLPIPRRGSGSSPIRGGGALHPVTGVISPTASGDSSEEERQINTSSSSSSGAAAATTSSSTKFPSARLLSSKSAPKQFAEPYGGYSLCVSPFNPEGITVGGLPAACALGLKAAASSGSTTRAMPATPLAASNAKVKDPGSWAGRYVATAEFYTSALAHMQAWCIGMVRALLPDSTDAEGYRALSLLTEQVTRECAFVASMDESYSLRGDWDAARVFLELVGARKFQSRVIQRQDLNQLVTDSLASLSALEDVLWAEETFSMKLWMDSSTIAIEALEKLQTGKLQRIAERYKQLREMGRTAEGTDASAGKAAAAAGGRNFSYTRASPSARTRAFSQSASPASGGSSRGRYSPGLSLTSGPFRSGGSSPIEMVLEHMRRTTGTSSLGSIEQSPGRRLRHLVSPVNTRLASALRSSLTLGPSSSPRPAVDRTGFASMLPEGIAPASDMSLAAVRYSRLRRNHSVPDLSTDVCAIGAASSRPTIRERPSPLLLFGHRLHSDGSPSSVESVQTPSVVSVKTPEGQVSMEMRIDADGAVNIESPTAAGGSQRVPRFFPSPMSPVSSRLSRSHAVRAMRQASLSPKASRATNQTTTDTNDPTAALAAAADATVAAAAVAELRQPLNSSNETSKIKLATSAAIKDANRTGFQSASCKKLMSTPDTISVAGAPAAMASAVSQVCVQSLSTGPRPRLSTPKDQSMALHMLPLAVAGAGELHEAGSSVPVEFDVQSKSKPKSRKASKVMFVEGSLGASATETPACSEQPANRRRSIDCVTSARPQAPQPPLPLGGTNGKNESNNSPSRWSF
eukprot:GHVT01087277.1.p1 GENE.GHVT01087277.1~~GHVT01087277.1.p1  ORF type:complete len:909 (-),score=172.47 GHVT01087277.1:508-3042(-)